MTFKTTIEYLDWWELAATSTWTSSELKYRCLGNRSGDVHIWNRFRQSLGARGRTLVSGALSFPVAKLTHLWNDNLICCKRETETTDGFVDGWRASSWKEPSFPTSLSALSHALILRMPSLLLSTGPTLFFLFLIPLKNRKSLQSTLIPTSLCFALIQTNLKWRCVPWHPPDLWSFSRKLFFLLWYSLLC